VIRSNDQQYWVYTAIEPDANKFLHIRLFATYTTALAEIFLGEPREKHNVDDVEREPSMIPEPDSPYNINQPSFIYWAMYDFLSLHVRRNSWGSLRFQDTITYLTTAIVRARRNSLG